MTTFSERESAFENKFKHDKELEFKVTNRRNKMLGLWAAQLLGIDGAEAEAYAKSVVSADFEKPGDDDVLQKVLADLAGKSVEVLPHELRAKMDEFLQAARLEVKEGR